MYVVLCCCAVLSQCAVEFFLFNSFFSFQWQHWFTLNLFRDLLMWQYITSMSIVFSSPNYILQKSVILTFGIWLCQKSIRVNFTRWSAVIWHWPNYFQRCMLQGVLIKYRNNSFSLFRYHLYFCYKFIFLFSTDLICRICWLTALLSHSFLDHFISWSVVCKHLSISMVMRKCPSSVVKLMTSVVYFSVFVDIDCIWVHLQDCCLFWITMGMVKMCIGTVKSLWLEQSSVFSGFFVFLFSAYLYCWQTYLWCSFIRPDINEWKYVRNNVIFWLLNDVSLSC